MDQFQPQIICTSEPPMGKQNFLHSESSYFKKYLKPDTHPQEPDLFLISNVPQSTNNHSQPIPPFSSFHSYDLPTNLSPSLPLDQIDPSISLNSAPQHELEYFYARLRQRQTELLDHPIRPDHPQFRLYRAMIHTFFNAKLLSLQSRLYHDTSRPLILRNILQTTYDKIILTYPDINDPWLTVFDYLSQSYIPL